MTTELRPAEEAAAGEDGATTFECPLCRRHVTASERVSSDSLESGLVSLVMANTPGWPAGRGLYRDCAARFHAALQYLRTHEAAPETPGAAILPTPVRIGALDEYRGRGVTIGA